MDLFKRAEVPAQLAAKYEAEAGRYWDLFYLRNKDRFFKNRNYFAAEFPALLTAATVLEVGCGAGNSVFPLLELNPSVAVYACDFAPSAVALVQAHPAYGAAAAAGRVVHAFVADITADNLTANVPPATVDACTMIFVLSAITPQAMPRALRRVAATLRPGGQLLFRDYAVGDLAEERFAAEGKQQRLGPNFFVRGDGTQAYYFSEEHLRRLFEAEGFECEYLRTNERVAENRLREERMERRFLQAVFTYRGGGTAGGSSSASSRGGSQQAGEAAAAAADDDAEASTESQQPQQSHVDGRQEYELRLAGNGPVQLQLRVSHWPRPQRQAAAADRAAAEALAAAVLRCPSYFGGTDVLEICLWDAPLAALAALHACRRAVVASGSLAEEHRVRYNVQCNSHTVVIERLRLHQLGWRSCRAAETQQQKQELEHDRQQQQLMQAYPAGFHAVLAVVPSGTTAAELQSLLDTVAALLSRSPRALALLCLPGAAEQQAAVAAAAAHPALAAANAPPELPVPEGLLCLRRL